MPKLADTQLVILSAAAERQDRVVLPLPKLRKIKGVAAGDFRPFWPRLLRAIGLQDNLGLKARGTAGFLAYVSGISGNSSLGGGGSSLERTRLRPISLINRENTGNFSELRRL